MNKKTFKIKGMHCAGCVRTIEKALLKTAGVRDASVNFAIETALIEFDENIISEVELAKVMKEIGYDLEIGAQVENGAKVLGDKGMKTISIKVIGMDSPHCAMTVENAIKNIAGIQNTDVDFANKRARVVFDMAKTNVEEIFKVITDSGYKPIKEEGRAEDILDKEKNEREKQTKTLKWKLIIGGLLSIAVFLGSFSEWFPFVPEFLTNYWVLFALTTPVQFWVG